MHTNGRCRELSGFPYSSSLQYSYKKTDYSVTSVQFFTSLQMLDCFLQQSYLSQISSDLLKPKQGLRFTCVALNMFTCLKEVYHRRS